MSMMDLVRALGGAFAHRVQRRLETVGARRRVNFDDAQVLLAQVFEIRRLVLTPAFRQQVDDRIAPAQPLGATFGHGEIELAEMATAQVISEVGGGELQ